MAKIENQFQQYLLDKRNHFMSKYVIVCEQDKIVIKHNPNNPQYTGKNNSSSPHWIQQYTDSGGIRTIDPFRGKLQLFWKVQGGQNNLGQLKSFLFSDGDDNEDVGFVLPNQINNGITKGNGGSTLPVTLYYPGKNSYFYTANNPYNYSFVESLDFSVNTKSGLESFVEDSNAGLMTFLMTCFLDPQVSLSNYNLNGGNYPHYEIYLPNIETPLHLNLNGTVMLNQQGDQSLREAFFSNVFKRLLSPIAYTNQYSNLDVIYAGNGINVDGSSMLEGDLKPKALGVFNDAAFEIPRFVSNQAIEIVDSLKGVGNFTGIQFADFDPVYNFLSTKYEQTLVGSEVAHTRIPNIYNEIKKLNETGNDGNVSYDEYLEGVLTGDSQVKYWANYFRNLEANGVSPATTNARFDHVFIQPEGQYSNQVIDQYKETFPMHVDIKFRSHSSQQKLMKILKSTGASQDLWKSIVKHVFGNYPVLEDGSVSYQIRRLIGEKHEYSPYSAGNFVNNLAPVTNFKFKAGMEKVAIVSEKNLNGLNPYEFQDPAPTFQPNHLPVFNFDKWIENYPEDTDDGYPSISDAVKNLNLTLKSSQFLSNQNNLDVSELSKNPLVILFGTIEQKAQLEPKVKELAADLMRTYRQIMEGKKAYSEVLFYRIQKKVAGNPNTIQNFWIENTPSVDVLSYTDTQIKYGVDYDYRIYAYTAVVGTKYRYAVNEMSSISGGKIPSILDFDQNSGDFKYLTYDETFTNGVPTVDLSKYLADFGDHPIGTNPGQGLDGLKYNEAIFVPYGSPQSVEPVFGWSQPALDLMKDYALEYPEIFNPLLELYQQALQESGNLTGDIQSIQEFKAKLEDYQDDLIDVATSVNDINFGELINAFRNEYNNFFVQLFDGQSLPAAKVIQWNMDLDKYFDGSSYGILTNNYDKLTFIYQDINSIQKIQDVLVDIELLIQKYNLQIQVFDEFYNAGVNSGNGVEAGKFTVTDELYPNGSPITLESVSLNRQAQVDKLNEIKIVLSTILKDLQEENLNETESLLKQVEADLTSKQTQLDNLLGEDQDRLYDYFEVLKREIKKKNLYVFSNDDETKKETRLQVVSEPYIKIVEVPVFQEIASAVDDPPLAPNVEFNAYFKNDSTLLITFDNTVGTEEAQRMFLPGDDLLTAERVRRKQDRDYTYNDTEFRSTKKSNNYVNSKVLFKTDDHASSYQVFRTLNKPTNKMDFNSGDLLYSIDAIQSSSFVDSIAPNVKYYYAFRTIDKHGQPSNLTPVYEVELVSDEGAIYLLIDVLDFSEKGKGNTYTSFRRFLQIDPAFLQTLINQDKTEFNDYETAFGVVPHIGVLEESVYDNKKFKIRVTSRATGKKLDFNVEFKKIMDEGLKTPPPDIL